MKLTLALTALTLALSVTACSAPAEDEPGFDCYSHGNKICGPATDADAATGWEVWDYSNGAHSLKIDTSRGYRVDYMGTSLEAPATLTDTQIALVGKDFKWHVFSATPTS